MQFLLADSNLLCVHRNTEIEAKTHRHTKSPPACDSHLIGQKQLNICYFVRIVHYSTMRYVAKIFKLKWENWNAIKKPFCSIDAKNKWKRHTHGRTHAHSIDQLAKHPVWMHFETYSLTNELTHKWKTEQQNIPFSQLKVTNCSRSERWWWSGERERNMKIINQSDCDWWKWMRANIAGFKDRAESSQERKRKYRFFLITKTIQCLPIT